jgi:hypothetical protein
MSIQIYVCVRVCIFLHAWSTLCGHGRHIGLKWNSWRSICSSTICKTGQNCKHLRPPSLSDWRFFLLPLFLAAFLPSRPHCHFGVLCCCLERHIPITWTWGLAERQDKNQTYLMRLVHSLLPRQDQVSELNKQLEKNKSKNFSDAKAFAGFTIIPIKSLSARNNSWII